MRNDHEKESRFWIVALRSDLKNVITPLSNGWQKRESSMWQTISVILHGEHSSFRNILINTFQPVKWVMICLFLRHPVWKRQ